MISWWQIHQDIKTLGKVLSRLQQYGVRLKKEKCKFMMFSIEYLGFHILGEENCPTKEKCWAILNALTSQDVTGLVNYYSKFLPYLADTLVPLYKLLGKQQPMAQGKGTGSCISRGQISADL